MRLGCNPDAWHGYHPTAIIGKGLNPKADTGKGINPDADG